MPLLNIFSYCGHIFVPVVRESTAVIPRNFRSVSEIPFIRARKCHTDTYRKSETSCRGGVLRLYWKKSEKLQRRTVELYEPIYLCRTRSNGVRVICTGGTLSYWSRRWAGEEVKRFFSKLKTNFVSTTSLEPFYVVVPCCGKLKNSYFHRGRLANTCMMNTNWPLSVAAYGWHVNNTQFVTVSCAWLTCGIKRFIPWYKSMRKCGKSPSCRVSTWPEFKWPLHWRDRISNHHGTDV